MIISSIPMVSKKREIESRELLEQEMRFSDMKEDDRSQRVCPGCAIMTCLRKCPKCGNETLEF